MRLRQPAQHCRCRVCRACSHASSLLPPLPDRHERRPQEQNKDGSGRGNLAIFLEHAAALGLSHQALDVFKMSSRLEFAPDTVFAPGSSGLMQPRLLSIDGGHDFDTATSDLGVAALVLQQGGIAWAG